MQRNLACPNSKQDKHLFGYDSGELFNHFTVRLVTNRKDPEDTHTYIELTCDECGDTMQFVVDLQPEFSRED
jgi:hypothetical protein